jgi:RNA polymerase sigma factor (sigma-70 family)
VNGADVSADSGGRWRGRPDAALRKSPCDLSPDCGILVRVQPSPSFQTHSFQQHVEPELIARLKRRDLAAFERIYRQFERAAWTLALRLTGRADVAQEVLQESMLKAYEHAAQYRGDAPFSAWLRKLVVNEALMRLRRDRLHVFEVFDDTRADVDASEPWTRADASALDRALNRLPDTARAVLWLYHVEGCTHIEIAEQFGRTVSFSKSQLARATRRLRELLQPHAEVTTPCTMNSIGNA